MATMTALKLTEPQTAQHQDVRERAYHRYATRLHAILWCRQKFQTTVIHDLSQGGAGLTGAFGVMPTDLVVLELLDGRRLTAEVRWWIQGRCGVVFNHPLQADDPLIAKALMRKPAPLSLLSVKPIGVNSNRSKPAA
jgi:PilZ domain